MPLIRYINCELNKKNILKENKNKSGIYRWINNENNKTYVGSSSNMNTRLYKYYSAEHLMKHKTPIHNALIKYGYSKFTFEVLEYCEKVDLIAREQYYLDLLKPEYNILALANSSLGFKHSKETLELFKNRTVSENTKTNLSLAATGRILSEGEKTKLSRLRKGIILSDEIRAKISATMTSKIGIPVVVKNRSTKEEIEYINLTEAAKNRYTCCS